MDVGGSGQLQFGITMRFDFGDEALLADAGRTGKPTMEPCAVVGITPVDNDALASAVNYPLGTILYTVEFGDGSDALVPEEHLVESSA
jgi:hypothetical protein